MRLSEGVKGMTAVRQWATGNPRERLSGWWNHQGVFIRTRAGGRADKRRVRTRQLQERNEGKKRATHFPRAVNRGGGGSVSWVSGWVGLAPLTAWGKTHTRRLTHPAQWNVGVFFQLEPTIGQSVVEYVWWCWYDWRIRPISFSYQWNELNNFVK